MGIEDGIEDVLLTGEGRGSTRREWEDKEATGAEVERTENGGESGGRWGVDFELLTREVSEADLEGFLW